MDNALAAEVFPPGDFLKEELDARGWSQSDLAEVLGKSEGTVSQLMNGRKAIDAKTAIALSAALGTSRDYWINLESAYRLATTTVSVADVEQRAKIYGKVPVKEIIRRGWIENSNSLAVLERNLLDFLKINALDEEPQIIPHAARKSTAYGYVSPAQTAWLFRAKHLAMRLDAKPYTSSRLRTGLDDLKTLLTHPEEVRRVPAVLAESGVRMLIVQPLNRTKIDGASFWLDSKSPVVVLSMRYDRIDYFWHTLWHELGHIRNKDGFAIDEDILSNEGQEDQRPAVELRADSFAVANLVPQDSLDDLVLRVSPFYSRKRLIGFAALEKVHPGIVLGQLQHRGEIGYANHRELLVKVRHIITSTAMTDGFGQSLPAFT